MMCIHTLINQLMAYIHVYKCTFVMYMYLFLDTIHGNVSIFGQCTECVVDTCTYIRIYTNEKPHG